MEDLNKVLLKLSGVMDLRFAINETGCLELLLVIERMVNMKMLPEEWLEELKSISF